MDFHVVEMINDSFVFVYFGCKKGAVGRVWKFEGVKVSTFGYK